MTRGKPVAASVAIVSLILVLNCTVSYSRTSTTSSFSISIASTGAALTTIAKREEPPLGETSRAKDTAAFVAYWKRQGYRVTADRQTLKPDGTVKTFHFAASRRRKGGDKAGTVAVTISDTPPLNMSSRTAKAAEKAPPLTNTSTAKEIAAYTAFYERHGYKITLNQQAYRSDGTVQEFHFVAKRGRGINQPSISANIDGATHNVLIEEVRAETSNP